MDFYTELDTRGLSDILRRVDFEEPVYVGWDAVFTEFKEIVENDLSVYVYGDYDVDGLMCAKILLEGLLGFGCTHVDVYPYRSRMHTLDPVAVKKCIQGRYDVMVIADTGSNDLSLLKLLVNSGVKVIVLDHHNTHLTYEEYPEGVVLLNTTLENSLGGDYRLSAGALCYTVMYKLAVGLGREPDLVLSTYATISLFADCMDMQSKLNRAIYYEARRIPREDLPRSVSLFMNQWSAFNARYIGFWFSPRINAMFRSENLAVINRLFFNPNIDAVEEARCAEIIETGYTENRALIEKVTDIIQVTEMDNFVLADLYTVDRYFPVEANKLYNYTGLIANRLCERYGKTAVTYCCQNNGYKGSVRDLYGRNYLHIFQQLCYAEGHNSAFGLHVRLLDFQQFLQDLNNIDKNYAIETIENEPIIMDYPFFEPDSALIEDMAQYNEFSGPNVPTVYLRKQLIGDMREKVTKYNYKYSWGEYFIQSEHQLSFGSKLLIKPIKSGTTKLLAMRGA